MAVSSALSPAGLRHDSARIVGDEPLLIKQRLGVPVVVCPDRQRAVTDLIEGVDVDVVLSDDGLQHYAMLRDVEIAVLDAERGMGNGGLLPAGPLREPVERSAFGGLGSRAQ